jgi:beta-lactamase class A
VKGSGLVGGLLGVLLLGTSANAAAIADWQFNRQENRLVLTTDEDVQPRVQLVSNPTRLVIDLPGVILGHPKTRHSIGPVIQEIRFGQFDSYTTRLVIALAPGYTLDPNQVKVQGLSANRWSVNLPTPEPLTSYQAALIPEIQDIRVEQPRISYAPRSTFTPSFTPGTNFGGVLALNNPMSALYPQIQALMSRYSFLQTGMFFVDLDTGNYLDIRGDRPFPAASTIKLPLLIAFFQDVDAGKIRLDEILVMKRNLITGGSGEMQDMPVGSRFTALHTATKMITISDNTATNMIIERLGGIAAVNQRFRSWGLRDTVIRNWLADLRGTNTTSPRDLVQVLALLEKDRLVSPENKERALGILRRTITRTLLPAGLGAGATISHKTGDIGFLIGDAGLVTTPSGKRYLGGIFVRRPYNDVRGRDFIRQVSRQVYTYLQQF